MEAFHISLIITIFVLLCAALFYMQKKFVSFSKRVMLALVVGIIYGLAIQFIYGQTSFIISESAEWINIVGNGFISLLRMLVIPLVFFAILSAFTKSKLANDFGKIGGLVIGMLAGTVAIAAAVGIFSAGIFGLEGMEITQGEAESVAIESHGQKLDDLNAMSVPEKVVSMLPMNIFYDLTEAFYISHLSRYFCIYPRDGIHGCKEKRTQTSRDVRVNCRSDFYSCDASCDTCFAFDAIRDFSINDK